MGVKSGLLLCLIRRRCIHLPPPRDAPCLGLQTAMHEKNHKQLVCNILQLF